MRTLTYLSRFLNPVLSHRFSRVTAVTRLTSQKRYFVSTRILLQITPQRHLTITWYLRISETPVAGLGRLK